MEVSDLSISVRLRRVRTETATVSVPITEDVTCADDEGGGRKIDVDKIIASALRMGALDSTQWELEKEPEISLHPVQTAPEQGPIQ